MCQLKTLNLHYVICPLHLNKAGGYKELSPRLLTPKHVPFPQGAKVKISPKGILEFLKMV